MKIGMPDAKEEQVLSLLTNIFWMDHFKDSPYARNLKVLDKKARVKSRFAMDLRYLVSIQHILSLKMMKLES